MGRIRKKAAITDRPSDYSFLADGSGSFEGRRISSRLQERRAIRQSLREDSSSSSLSSDDDDAYMDGDDEALGSSQSSPVKHANDREQRRLLREQRRVIEEAKEREVDAIAERFFAEHQTQFGDSTSNPSTSNSTISLLDASIPSSPTRSIRLVVGAPRPLPSDVDSEGFGVDGDASCLLPPRSIPTASPDTL